MATLPHEGPTGLSAKDVLALSERTDLPALFRALAHFGAVFVTGGLIWRAGTEYGLFWTVPLLFLQGFFVAFLFSVLHECMHKTAFKTAGLNLVVGSVAAFAIFLPFHYYTSFHWAHHRHTQDPEKDPELLVGFVPQSDAWLVVAFSGILQLVARVRLMTRHALTGATTRAPWISKSQRASVVTEARVYLLLYAIALAGSVVAGSGLLLWTWIVPLVLGQIFLRPYLFAEHTGCGQSRSAFENTRTTMTSGLLKWFSWNMPYHAEHHAHPTVPFHALPRLHRLVRDRVVHRGPSYRAVTREVWGWLRAARANKAALSSE